MQPIIFRYTEGRETYAVHACGGITRPQNEGGPRSPSGQWRFVGIADNRGRFLCGLPEFYRKLLAGDELPKRFHIVDFDHGTRRLHGHELDAARVYLERASGDCRGLVDELESARNNAARERAERENAERKAAISKGAMIWQDSRYGLSLHSMKGGKFGVLHGESASADLSRDEAAQEIGAAIMWAALEEESGQ